MTRGKKRRAPRVAFAVLTALVLAMGMSGMGSSRVPCADAEETEAVFIDDSSAVETADVEEAALPSEASAGEADEGVAADDVRVESDEDLGQAGGETTAAPDAEGPQGETVLEVASDATAHFHVTIDYPSSEIEAGTTVIFNIKYTIDPDTISEGDYVTVSIPPELATKVKVVVAPQHFKEVVDLGNGNYRLVFAEGAESAISGGFNIYMTAANVDENTPGTIVVGDALATITVIAGGSPEGVGVFDDTIMKDGAENDGVYYGGYDYSEGYENPAQIGIYDATDGLTLKYRLYVNRKAVEMSGITVTDPLPDGMTFNADHGVEVTEMETGNPVDPSLYTVDTADNTITFTYPGTLTVPLQINYWVDIEPGNTAQYVNRAEITYTSGGTAYAEHRDYVLQGSNYSASNGVKSVDHAIIGNDASDQWVTYTIKFWNQNGFSTGEINLVDVLADELVFLYAEPNDTFSIDASDPHRILITNTKPIPSSATEYVRFVVDFSNVLPGAVIANTVGGNTTHTLKKAQANIVIHKYLDNAADTSRTLSDGEFSFEVCEVDAQGVPTGDVVTLANDAQGEATASFEYEAAGTHYYRITEVAGTDEAIEYDGSTVYATVEVSGTADGGLSTAVSYGGEPGAASGASAAEFTNVVKPTEPDEPVVPDEPTPDEPIVPASGEGTVTVDKSADKASVTPGDTLTYTLTVENVSEVAVEGVYVKDFVPANTTYVSCQGPGATYGATTDGREFATWYIDEIGSGETVELTLTVKVNECTDGTPIVNTAYWGTTDDKPRPSVTPANTTNTATTTIAGGTPSTRHFVPKTSDGGGPLLVLMLVTAGAGCALIACGLRKSRCR